MPIAEPQNIGGNNFQV